MHVSPVHHHHGRQSHPHHDIISMIPFNIPRLRMAQCVLHVGNRKQRTYCTLWSGRSRGVFRSRTSSTAYEKNAEVRRHPGAYWRAFWRERRPLLNTCCCAAYPRTSARVTERVAAFCRPFLGGITAVTHANQMLDTVDARRDQAVQIPSSGNTTSALKRGDGGQE